MKFTVITPCYNSTKTLRSTYESLLSQNYKDFEWIIIDDFSTDNGETRSLILEIASEAPFLVKYKFLKENYYGSRSAYEACLLAEGEYACILDHDDQILPEALSLVNTLISENKLSDIAGVCGRCINENGDFIGTPFSTDILIATEGEIRFKYKIKGETFHFTKVDLLKKYFLKMKPGYTNGYVWASISNDNIRYIYTNEAVRVYDTAILTSTTNDKRSVTKFISGKMECLEKTIYLYRGFLNKNLLFSLKMFYAYNLYSYISGVAVGNVKKISITSFLLNFISLPIAYFRSKKYKV